jgi:hypothetical protein
LHCGEDCRVSYEDAVKAAHEALIEEGFQQTETPNLYVKDGFGVTVEEILHGGLDRIMARITA